MTAESGGGVALRLSQHVTSLTLFREPRLERQPCGISAGEELQTLSPGRADPPPASYERIAGEEGRLDGQNIVARDIARRIGALKKDLQARKVRVSMVGMPNLRPILESVQRKIGIGGLASIRKIDECNSVG